jgi:hypothetical protein
MRKMAFAASLALCFSGSGCNLQLIGGVGDGSGANGTGTGGLFSLSVSQDTVSTWGTAQVIPSGGSAPYTFSILGGSPATVDSQGWVHMPWQQGSVTVEVRDSGGHTSTIAVDYPGTTLQWGNGASNIFFNQVVPASDGSGYFISGGATGIPGATLQGSVGAADVFVAKYNSMGTRLWVVEYGGGSGGGGATITASSGIHDDGAGGVYIWGSCQTWQGNYGGTVINPPANGFGERFFLSRVNSAGHVVYTDEIEGGGLLDGLWVNFVAGSAYVLGDGTLGMNADNTYGSSASDFVPWIAKIDAATGAKSYVTLLETDNVFSMVNVGGMVIDGTGAVYLSGGISNSNGTPDTLAGSNIVGSHTTADAFVFKLNPDGTKAWGLQVGDGAGDWFSSLVALPSGGVVAVGTCKGVVPGGTQLGTHSASGDLLVVSYSSAGAINWITQHGGGAATSAGASAVAAQTILGVDRVVVVGNTSGAFGGTQIGVHGALDGFINAYDSTGALLFATQWGQGGETTYGTSLTLSNSGANDYLVTGASTGAVLTGTQLGAHGRTDAYLARFSSAGALIWADRLGGGGTSDTGATYYNFGTVGLDFPYSSVLERPNGSLYWAGTTTGDLGGWEPGGVGGQQIWGMALDSGGNKQWLSQIGAAVGTSTAWGVGNSFGLDPSGDLLLWGSTSTDLSGTQLGAHSANDGVLFRLRASDGTLE